MEITKIVEWLEQDESPNFGAVFYVDKEDLTYLVTAIEVSLSQPKMKFNQVRYKKLIEIHRQFKSKLKEGQQ